MMTGLSRQGSVTAFIPANVTPCIERWLKVTLQSLGQRMGVCLLFISTYCTICRHMYKYRNILYYVMLCYAMLCHVMLCYVMLCYVMLCHVI